MEPILIMKKILLILLLVYGTAQAQVLPLTAKLKPAGKGDNTYIQLTLANYAYSVTQAARETQRKSASRAFCQSLATVSDIENKAFIISLLEICGEDKAVPFLKQYLHHKRLCDPAARALIHINSPSAKVALLAALKKSTGSNRITLIAAIGQLRYLGALDDLTAFVKSNDPLVKRTALLALANLGNAGSEPILAAEAEKSNFRTDTTDATIAYLLFAQRLAQNWPIGPAVKAAEKLQKKTPDVYMRIAALKLLAATRANGQTLLLQAVDDSIPAYREAALKMAEKIITADNAAIWVRKAENSEGLVKAGVLTILGNSKQTAAQRVIKTALTDKDPAVKIAAINAAGALGNSELVPSLLSTMKTADTLSVTAIRDVLLSIRGLDVVSMVTGSLPTQPPFAQAALKEVLAIRKPAH
jgi:HEAT repeat protein